MIFLNPTILLGLLAASIPILIHLLNFKKLKKVEFSSLAFLKELQKSKIRKIKIRQWILLLLRTLIIVFLVLSFARPTLEGVNLIGASASAKSSIVFVLDNSLSMSYVSDKGSLFNQAKKSIGKIIGNMEEGDEAYFITISDSIKKTSNKETALKVLDELKISQLSNSLLSKIHSAIKTLESTANINKEIFLFSDFQKSTFFETTNDSILAASSDIKIYSFNMSDESRDNYSVADLQLLNSIIELNKPIGFSANINNNSANPITDLSTSLFINGERVSQQSINLKPNESKGIEYESFLKTTGLTEVKLELEEDNIIEDNTAFLSFIVPERINVLLLYQSLASIKFLEAALNSTTISERIIVNKNSVENLSFLTLSNYDVIFLVSGGNSDVHPLYNYLSTGGKLVFFPDENIDKVKLNSILNSLKLPTVNNIVSTGVRESNFAEFDEIDLNHPLFTNLFSSTRKGQIESPNIINYLQFNKLSGTKEIISLNDKSMFLGEQIIGDGKAIIFNSAPLLSSSDFPIKALFAPLLTKIVFYLSSNNNNMNTYLVGDEVSVKLNNVYQPTIDVVMPDGTEKITLSGNERNILNYTNTNLAGNYKFLSGGKLLGFASLNINPKESDLQKMDDDKINDYFKSIFEDRFFNLTHNEDYLNRIQQARYGTELWKLFLILAFLLALVEMYISRANKKDLLNIDQK